MSLQWINLNSRLQAGITLINSLSRTKFNSLLQHVVQSTNENIFTPDELNKLQDLFKLGETNVQLLILSLAHIVKQSSKIILKPTVLQKQLIEQLKLDEEKAEDFVKLWTQQIKTDFDLENCKKLENVCWELNLQTASTLCNRETIPNARIQLHLGTIDEGKENFAVELNEDELVQFYNNLEQIQIKLDSINSK